MKWRLSSAQNKMRAPHLHVSLSLYDVRAWNQFLVILSWPPRWLEFLEIFPVGYFLVIAYILFAHGAHCVAVIAAVAELVTVAVVEVQVVGVAAVFVAE